MERLDPFEQPAVLVGTVPISKVCRKAPVDLPLLDASGVVPFHLVAELVLLFYVVSVALLVWPDLAQVYRLEAAEIG